MKILNVAGDALKFPPVIRGVIIAVIVEFLLNALPRVNVPTQSTDVSTQDLPWGLNGHAYWLAMTPANVWKYPWTLVTSSFLEPTIIELLWSLVFLIVCGRYLERIWGSKPMLKFIAVVLLGSNIATLFVTFIEFFILRMDQLWYSARFHGLMALQTGFLVALTQLMPEHQIILLRGLIKVRIKSLPMAYVTVSNIMCVVWNQVPWFLIQPGWLIAWFYLRFFKESDNSSFRGDQSETFSFANWFPPFVQPYVSRISNIVYNFAVKVGLLKSYNNFDRLPVSAPSAGTARAEAERRRAMALATLDQRIASAKAMASTASSEKATSQPSATPAATPSTTAVQPQQQQQQHQASNADASTSKASSQGAAAADTSVSSNLDHSSTSLDNPLPQNLPNASQDAEAIQIIPSSSTS